MTTEEAPYKSQPVAQTFDMEMNPIKVGSKRIMNLYAILFFLLLIVPGIVYAQVNLLGHLFIAAVIGIAVILLLVFLKVSKKYTQESVYHLALHASAITLFKNHKAVRHIPFNDLTCETSFWGSSNALHPAIILKSSYTSNISIGTRDYSMKDGRHKNILDYTDFLIANKESWLQLTQTMSSK